MQQLGFMGLGPVGPFQYKTSVSSLLMVIDNDVQHHERFFFESKRRICSFVDTVVLVIASHSRKS